MRGKTCSKIIVDRIVLLVTMLILTFPIISVSNLVSAQGEKLIMDITNESYEHIDKIGEGEYFLVSAYTLDENNQPVYQLGVEIDFNGETYLIPAESENPDIFLEAPKISENTVFTITASKVGFISDTGNITVINKLQLVVTPDDYTVEANKRFSVIVTDENGKTVAGAKVGIQSCTEKGSVDVTNDGGRAWLVAPEDQKEITLIAQKDGYTDAKPTLLGVNTNPGLIEVLIQNAYLPVLIAIALLVIAIVFVNFRQKRYSTIESSKGFSNGKTLKLDNSSEKNVMSPFLRKTINRHKSKENSKVEQKREPKVEEIRINKPSKNKEIVSVGQKDQDGKEVPHKTVRRRDFNWFEGTNNIRYKIDKITGKIDEEGVDKWFEGMDDIRAKIDEKIRRNNEKKK